MAQTVGTDQTTGQREPSDPWGLTKLHVQEKAPNVIELCKYTVHTFTCTVYNMEFIVNKNIFLCHADTYQGHYAMFF